MAPRTLLVSAVVALAAIATPLPIGAQAPPASTPPASGLVAAPDEASRAVARQLGEKLGFTQQAQSVLVSVRNQVAITLARSSGKSPEDAGRAVDELIMPDFNAAAPELVGIITDGWASTFTIGELRELYALYTTPLGNKLARSVGPLNQLIGNTSRIWAQGILQTSLRAHEAELRARGLQN